VTSSNWNNRPDRVISADDPQPVIIEFARYLDRKNVPLHRLGIQFVQIGDDPDATEALKELDEQLGPVHGIRVSNYKKFLTLVILTLLG
jgi:hypothetical protein